MVSGLRNLGHEVDVIELAGRYPIPQAGAPDPAVALTNIAVASYCVVDGLALPALAGLETVLEARSVIGLIHHPTSLETGLEPSVRNTLATIEAALLPRLSRLIVTSETTAETLVRDFSVDGARIRIVSPGMDDLPRSKGSGKDRCEVLSVGALIPRKGHEILIRALARLCDLDWNLTIIGSDTKDPACSAGLRALVAELGVTERVTFTGELPQQKAEPYWRAADIFALATFYEGYGMAIAEALRRGLPVAVTAGGAAASLVGPEAGVVCQPNDREQLSRALRRLVFSPELRAEMGKVAWQAGQALPSWATQADRFAAALRTGTADLSDQNTPV